MQRQDSHFLLMVIAIFEFNLENKLQNEPHNVPFHAWRPGTRGEVWLQRSTAHTTVPCQLFAVHPLAYPEISRGGVFLLSRVNCGSKQPCVWDSTLFFFFNVFD